MHCSNCQPEYSNNGEQQSWRRWIPSPCTILWIIFIVLLASQAWGQSNDQFRKAVNHYQNAEYDQAVKLFVQMDRPEARLFAGKSYYAMGQFLNAQAQLQDMPAQLPSDIKRETAYTLSLVDYQLKRYGSALERLYTLLQRPDVKDTPLQQDAQDLYDRILPYLTLAQRREAFYQSDQPKVRFDLVSAAFGRVNYATAKALYQIFKTSLTDTTNYTLQLQQFRSQLSDSANYAIRSKGKSKYPQAPKGTIYNIGVALPSFSPNTREYEVAQGLYNGFLMATESFNRRNNDRKAFLQFEPTDPADQKMEHVINKLAWEGQIDALLGPLFSETAHSMSGMAEQYQIPLVAPLANADTLNLDNPYLFQMNPTFRVRGQKMAEFAVNTLGLDTLAVIAQRNGWGTEAAFAFRTYAERLGAKVPYFFLRNFEENGYDLSDITDHFAGNPIVLDSLHYQSVDAVYAPFTGQGAPTLIDLLMTDLEVSRSNVTVLGSEEWSNVSMSADRRDRFNIYYTQGYSPNTQSEELKRFNDEYQSRFGKRPTRYSYIGFDTADFVLKALEKVQNPALLKDGLKMLKNYQGLTGPVNFEGGHVNLNVQVQKMTAPSE